MGLAEAVGTQYAMSSLPFLLEYGDGAPPVSRVFIGLTPDGSAVLNGSAPRGLTISIGSFDKEDVLFTTAATVDAALEDALGNASLVLAYSCIARSMSLGVEQLLEAELVKSRLTGKLPFMMAYAGGEFCPMQSSDSGVVNRFHNNTLILCVL
jgi:hypothetical protein